MADARDIERWIATSQRAAGRKTTEPMPGDTMHFVRKVSAACKQAKPSIDTAPPRSMARWSGRNFHTIARRFEDARALRRVQQDLEHVALRSETIESEASRAIKAQPPLLMRRVKDHRHASSDEADAPMAEGALTVQESLDARLWSLNPPWSTRLSDHARPTLRRGNIALPANSLLLKKPCSPAEFGADPDLLHSLGASPTPKG